MRDSLAAYFGAMRAHLHGEDVPALRAPFHADSPAARDGRGLSLYRWLVLEDRRALLNDAAPLARRACGPDAWEALTTSFVLTQPTPGWDTSAYADAFPAFLQARAEAAGAQPFVAELAETSILLRRAYLSELPLDAPALERSVFVRMFAHDVSAVSVDAPIPPARATALILYRCIRSGHARTTSATAARVVALAEALGEALAPGLREAISSEALASAHAELVQLGVLPEPQPITTSEPV